MKKNFVNFSVLTVLSFSILSFAVNPAKNEKDPVQTFKVDTKNSSLVWTGKKVTGQHTGTIALSSGSLTLDGKNIKAGNFDIDLSSITVTDITDQESNAKLVRHLKSDDFFSVEKNPTAKFILTSATSKGADKYLLKGNLTIKGITNEIEFPASIKIEVNKITAVAKIVVDRTKYDIKFRSTNFFENLGDKAIDNNFELDIKLVATDKAL